ncbi:MAG TPA: DNA recombination protein RmuC [Rubellimicrobium sp.]|nr:DNA recombination protein RmuC [Rubellimicrobium sp.]
MDLQTLTLIACLALLLVVVALLLPRGPKSTDRQELEQARTAAEVAGARMDAQARLLAEREARITALATEIEALRGSHRQVEMGRADAESRCAQATEAVVRLERAAKELREDGSRLAQQLREDAALVAKRLEGAEAELGRLRADHAALQTERDERLASAEREVANLRALREEMTKEFQALAARTLRETGSQFSEAHHQKLTELLTPFREQVGRFETELRAVHQEADKDRAVLAEQIRALSAQAQAVSQDAANLARALKGDKQRQGAWGEAQLERYLELMGYRRDVDYVVQSSRLGDEGDRRRPDLILHMPGGKTLVIDSKVSLSAYADALAAETEDERERCLRLHARNVRDRVDELAARDYQGMVDGSVDWVLLFMPIEGAVSAAWAYDGEIAAYAMERGVALAYPTSLLMALKTVKHLWNVEKRNKNAEQIAERAGRLYDKLSTFMDSFARVGGALDDAKKAHEKALGQLTRGAGNLVGQVEKLKSLGARTGKSLAVDHDGDAEPDDGLESLPTPANDDTLRVVPAAE